MKKLVPCYVEVRDALRENVAGPIYESFGKPIRDLACGTLLPGDAQKKLMGGEEGAIDSSAFSALMECMLGAALLSGGNPYGIPLMVEGGTRFYAAKGRNTPVGPSIVELPYRGAKAIYKHYLGDAAGKESERELTGGRLEQYSASVNPK